MKITKISRDSKGKIMWVKGGTDMSPLTYRELVECSDIKSGSIVKNNIRYISPFILREEKIE